MVEQRRRNAKRVQGGRVSWTGRLPRYQIERINALAAERHCSTAAIIVDLLDGALGTSPDGEDEEGGAAERAA